MSTRNYKAKRINWIDIVDPSKKEVDELVLKYGFHELDKEALLEDNQRARVDTYEDYIFIVLHFPKYDTKTKRYILNEFNIFLSKKFLITIRYHTSTSVDRVFDNFMK